MERLRQQNFGTHPNGSEVIEYTLINGSGIQVSVLNLGCTLTKILTPDQTGQMADILLGFDDLKGYLKTDNPYMGSIIGRTANRIKNSAVTLDYQTWELSCNHGEHHLHGGKEGFDKKIWSVKDPVETEKGITLSFNLASPHLDQGYPGNLNIATSLTLTDDNCLSIQYTASTDQTTLINLTHHPYFNLTGNPEKPCQNHELTLYASRFTEPDPQLIPTGKIAPVDELPIDFLSPHPIGDRINNRDWPMTDTNGYDHNLILDRTDETPHKAAQVLDPDSGRMMTISTTQPCMQFYSGNGLSPALKGKNQVPFFPQAGFCIEPQGYPDSTRHDLFEDTILYPHETYKQTIEYWFGVKTDPNKGK